MEAAKAKTHTLDGNIPLSIEYGIKVSQVTNAALKLVMADKSDKAKTEYDFSELTRRVWKGGEDVPFNIIYLAYKLETPKAEIIILSKTRPYESEREVFRAMIQEDQISNVTLNLIEEPGISQIIKAADALEMAPLLEEPGISRTETTPTALENAPSASPATKELIRQDEPPATQA